MKKCFKCGLCGRQTEYDDADDAESRQEAVDNFGLDPAAAPELFARICGECYAKVDPKKHPELARQAREELKKVN